LLDVIGSALSTEIFLLQLLSKGPQKKVSMNLNYFLTEQAFVMTKQLTWKCSPKGSWNEKSTDDLTREY